MEFHSAGGDTDTVEALANVRNVTAATLVCKRGTAGATAFKGPVLSAFWGYRQLPPSSFGIIQISFLVERPKRIVGNLPDMTVRVGEIS